MSKTRQQIQSEAFSILTDSKLSAEDEAYLNATVDRLVRKTQAAQKAKMN